MHIGYNQKLSVEYVAQQFALGGCQFVGPYLGSTIPIQYICNCGQPAQARLADFLRGNRCNECGKRKRAKSKARSYESVKEYFQQRGCELLSTEYVNNAQPLVYRCACGDIFTSRLDSFQERALCPAHKQPRGKDHYRWNPDRAYVDAMRSIKQRSLNALKSTLRAAGQRKSGKSQVLLGYNVQALKAHLETFPDWPFLSKGDWCLDHIFPIKAFVEHGIRDTRLINCLENLQPLPARDNYLKNDRYDETAFQTWLSSHISVATPAPLP